MASVLDSITVPVHVVPVASKLDTAIKYSHLFVSIAVCILCAALSLLAYHANQSLTKAGAIMVDAASAVKSSQLLIKQSSYLVLNAGLTMNQLRAESLKEGVVLDQTNKQVSKTLTDLDTFVTTSTKGEATLLTTANETVQKVQPVLSEAHTTLQTTTQAVASLQTVTKSLNKVVSDPSIPASLKAAQKASESIATAMSNVSDMTADGKAYLHHLLHPKWCRSIANWSLAVVHALNPL